MRAHLRYLRYVLRHKWFVLVAGRRVGAPLWRLVVHDWTKFLPSEWGPYVASFYGPWSYKDRPAYVVEAFDIAWNLHQKRNPHHWQFWLLMNDSGPAYPRYAITSADGVGVYHSITEFHGPYADGDQPRVEHDVSEGLHINGGPEADERYRMLRRLTNAANARRPVALPMPEHFIREMVADWMGAGRAITGRWEAAAWYQKNRENIVLHPDTRSRVEDLLRALPPGGAT